MVYMVIGMIGFVSFLLFDISSMKKWSFVKYVFIVIGISLMVWSTVQMAYLAPSFLVSSGARIVAFGLSVVFFGLLIYSVFIEVGIKTYKKVAHHELVTDGTYSLVRHPGVIWLFLLYFFLSIVFMNTELLITAFVWTFVNTLYIMFQERIVLRKIFQEYDRYTLTTPMVIPNIQSLRKFMTSTIWRKE
ncbi:methyltransferase family protein [Candidatus Xianfuyuplasma coldseepsis]|uniref:Protein-S-isoprenylcysteine O-methyltransferase n=1 Tax=Candidatus Xianfuyuplasma coldseepsis TaxID=2782163 RepID=A0A7L7KNG6_9MOLU|nr:methyltransferase [Xianfuyuplasma coldseepsis]QMS84193.1 hypothetical protein G4Z02_00025 [Xianfuyuplasma coldseepsis]